jgi:hypothetical protein
MTSKRIGINGAPNMSDGYDRFAVPFPPHCCTATWTPTARVPSFRHSLATDSSQSHRLVDDTVATEWSNAIDDKPLHDKRFSCGLDCGIVGACSLVLQVLQIAPREARFMHSVTRKRSCTSLTLRLDPGLTREPSIVVLHREMSRSAKAAGSSPASD